MSVRISSFSVRSTAESFFARPRHEVAVRTGHDFTFVHISFLLDIALFRFPATSPRPNWVPFHSIINDWRYGGQGFVVNFLGNLVAFLPMGVLPPLIRARPTALWHVHALQPGDQFDDRGRPVRSGRRVPDVDDLILNTTGGAIGYRSLRLWQSYKATKGDQDSRPLEPGR